MNKEKKEKKHAQRVHPGFPNRERLAKGQGKPELTNEPKPKRPRTYFEQDELAVIDKFPENRTQLACPLCERVFYNEDDLNDHEMTTHIPYKDVKQDNTNLKEDLLSK